MHEQRTLDTKRINYSTTSRVKTLPYLALPRLEAPADSCRAVERRLPFLACRDDRQGVTTVLCTGRKCRISLTDADSEVKWFIQDPIEAPETCTFATSPLTDEAGSTIGYLSRKSRTAEVGRRGARLSGRRRNEEMKKSGQYGLVTRVGGGKEPSVSRSRVRVLVVSQSATSYFRYAYRHRHGHASR